MPGAWHSPSATGAAQIGLGLHLGSVPICHLKISQLFMHFCSVCAMGFCLRIKHVCIRVFFFSLTECLRGVLSSQCGKLGKSPSCDWILTSAAVEHMCQYRWLVCFWELLCSLSSSTWRATTGSLGTVIYVLCADVRIDTFTWGFFFKPLSS